MKQFFFAALLLGMLGVGACSKKDPDPADAPGRDIIGEWDWVSSIGGIAGQTYTPASQGLGITWVFKADSTFQEYTTKQGAIQLTQSTTFALSRKQSNYSTQPERFVTINWHPSNPSSGTVQPFTYLIREVGTQLVLSDQFADGYTTTYRRRK